MVKQKPDNIEKAMDVLIVVSTQAAADIFAGLAAACERSNCQWSVFFTNDGVLTLKDEAIDTLSRSATNAIACHDSWSRYCGEHDAPVNVQMGSQTNHSELAGIAKRIVSL